MAGNRINIRDIVWAKLIKDTKSELQYGQIKSIVGAMTIGMTPSISAGDLYGDGVKRESEQALTGYDITFEVNKLPLATRAEWLGNEIDSADGTLTEKADDSPIEFALGFVVDLSGEGVECVWFYKVSASPITNNLQQSTDSRNYSTDTLTLKAKFRIFDNGIKKFGDTSADSTLFTKAKADTFFQSVPGDQTTP